MAPAEARLLNLVEGLAPVAGVARPHCVVLDDPAPNALALGRDARHGCIVVTSGLLRSLSRMELEGVVARALVDIRDGTTAAPTDLVTTRSVGHRATTCRRRSLLRRAQCST